MVIKLSSITILGLFALNLSACSSGMDGSGMAEDVSEALKSEYPTCGLVVAYNGVGEGDSENVYISLEIHGTKEAGKYDVLAQKDVAGKWSIDPDSLSDLRAKLRKLCE